MNKWIHGCIPVWIHIRSCKILLHPSTKLGFPFFLDYIVFTAEWICEICFLPNCFLMWIIRPYESHNSKKLYGIKEKSRCAWVDLIVIANTLFCNVLSCLSSLFKIIHYYYYLLISCLNEVISEYFGALPGIPREVQLVTNVLIL